MSSVEQQRSHSPQGEPRNADAIAHEVEVAVVGAGITGLSAAFELQRRGVDVVVLEADSRAGGKVDATSVGDLVVDSGPDGFLRREPQMVELCEQLGLGDDLVSPATAGAFVWLDGALAPIPPNTVLGVPHDAAAPGLSGILSTHGITTLRQGLARDWAPLGGDDTVGSVLRPRIGDEAFERLVDPLLGGINAGSADEMSIAACAPVLHQAARLGGPFGQALRSAGGVANRASGGAPGPVFAGIRGGTTRAVRRLEERLAHRIKLNHQVRGLSRQPAGRSFGQHQWRLRTDKGQIRARSVVLTAPAGALSALLGETSPAAASLLGEIGYSDVVLVTFVVDAQHLARPLDASGFLVPRASGMLTTACSWTSSKWEHYHQDHRVVLRVSAGRTDDRRWLTLSHGNLVRALSAELAAFGVTDHPDAAARAAHRVNAWPASLPQYRPGHLNMINEIESRLADHAPGVFVAGAFMRGLGLPACVRQGRSASVKALEFVGD